MDYTIEDTFDVSAQRYWDVFFSDDYNAALWPELDVDRKILKFERSGEGSDLVIVREAELTPHREAPKAIAKLVTTTISYVEKNEYRASKSAMTTEIVPNFMRDRITNRGTYRVEPMGEDRCKRIWEGVCIAKVPLLGGKVEEFLVSQVRESYRAATAFTRKWIADHPA